MSEALPGFPPPSWESQQQRLDGMALSSDYVRDTAVYVARSFVGLGESDPRLYDALYPWDPEWARKSMAKKQSKCALVVLMWLRALGIELPWDGLPLASRFGSVAPPAGRKPPPDPMTQIQMLSAYKASNEPAQPGCAHIIQRPGEGLSTHALVVVGYEEDTLISVDGGHGPVRETRRKIVRLGNQVCLQDQLMGNRVILGQLDPAKMRGSIVREYSVPG